MESVLGYRAVALLLLLVVSMLAIVFEIFPVLLSALLSALIWNFLFIPPVFTFHIDSAEDGLLFLMYFVIALVNAVFTSRIRKTEKQAIEKEEKEHTIQLYNTLLSSLSHELRTPISTIIGAVDTLQDTNTKLSEQLQSELLNEIDIASTRLNSQVENLLNMSRLQSGFLKLKLDWCDVNDLVFGVIQKSVTPIVTQKILFAPNEELPLCKLDAGLIEQVVHNLLTNAIQYTPPHSTIQIQAKLNGKNLVLIVSDNGTGFPAHEIPKVFDKFYRVPHTRAGGTGLGLSIAKGYAEAHGGFITLTNATPHGAVFTIELPCEFSPINIPE